MGLDLLADLGTPRLSWRRLKLIIEQAPRGSAIHRSQHGDDADWGLAEHLAATLIDIQQMNLWAKAKKGTRKPARFPRPGVKDDSEHVRGKAQSQSSIRDWISRKNRR